MTVTVQAGHLSATSLEAWLTGQPFQAWVQSLAGTSAHALIEYVHRFAFVAWTELRQDFARGEIGKFSLRGRIFWDTGQVAWRRLDGDKWGLCLLLETDPCPCLPADIELAEEFIETLEPEADQTLILWGTYNAGEQAFLERRVAGSRPIAYPTTITTACKTYPVLEVRLYCNEDGDPSMWRFVRPGARNKDEWPGSSDEETS